MILTTCVLLLFANEIFCDVDVLGNDTNWNEERRLQKDILKDYDMMRPPQNITTIGVRFILKTFYFDRQEEVFSIYVWLFLNWHDERLKWDPEKYKNISETQMNFFQIWLPRMQIRSAFGSDEGQDFLGVHCQVRSSGQISCLRPSLMDTECYTNLTRWPYDLQSCTFKFGTVKRTIENVVLTFKSSRGISMFGAEYGPGWNIIDFHSGENATSDNQIYMNFVVERQGVGLAAVIIFPSLVLSVLTISSLFLDTNITRLGVMVFSLAGHFDIFHVIAEIIPDHGAAPPSIIRFLSLSFVLTTIAVGLTLALRLLRRRTVAPPQWVFYVNDFVFKRQVKFLIWPRWEAPEPIDDEHKSVEDWTNFANIVNSVTIALYIIVYLSTFLAFIPHQLPIDYIP